MLHGLKAGAETGPRKHGFKNTRRHVWHLAANACNVEQMTKLTIHLRRHDSAEMVTQPLELAALYAHCIDGVHVGILSSTERAPSIPTCLLHYTARRVFSGTFLKTSAAESQPTGSTMCCRDRIRFPRSVARCRIHLVSFSHFLTFETSRIQE